MQTTHIDAPPSGLLWQIEGVEEKVDVGESAFSSINATCCAGVKNDRLVTCPGLISRGVLEELTRIHHVTEVFNTFLI